MKTDELGVYDENAIPDDLKLPLKLDRENDAISGDDNFVLARFNFSSETVLAGFARRRAEFIVRLANGELLWSHGKILIRAAEQWQDGQMVVTFVPNGVLTKEEFDSLAKKIIESMTPVERTQLANGDGLSAIALREIGKTDMAKLARYRARVKRYTEKLNRKYAEEQSGKE